MLQLLVHASPHAAQAPCCTRTMADICLMLLLATINSWQQEW
jgi:hypothetical protein